MNKPIVKHRVVLEILTDVSDDRLEPLSADDITEIVQTHMEIGKENVQVVEYTEVEVLSTDSIKHDE